MKRLLGGLILIATGLDVSAASAKTDRIGSWEITAEQTAVEARCVMVMGERVSGFLVAFIDPEGDFQLGVATDHFDWLPNEDGFAELLFDGKIQQIGGSYRRGERLLVLQGRQGVWNGNNLEAPLRQSQRVEVQGRGFQTAFLHQGTGEALDRLKECASEDADAGSRVAEEPAGASNPDLGTAMRSITGGQPMVAQFQCSVTARDLTGLIDPSGRGGAETVTIGVAADGSGFINGSTMVSARVERGDGGELIGTAFTFQDVNRAMSGGATPLPEMGTFTAEQNAALQALPGIMNGMLGAAMGDRKRFMVVSLQQNNVVFFDLTPAGGTATLTAPECVRTM